MIIALMVLYFIPPQPGVLSISYDVLKGRPNQYQQALKVDMNTGLMSIVIKAYKAQKAVEISA